MTQVRGWAVIVLNSHGALDAFGPFLDEDEMSSVATFAGHLCPTWTLDLDDGHMEKHGLGDGATYVEATEGPHTGPARQRSPRLLALLPYGCVEGCAGGPHHKDCATRKETTGP